MDAGIVQGTDRLKLSVVPASQDGNFAMAVVDQTLQCVVASMEINLPARRRFRTLVEGADECKKGVEIWPFARVDVDRQIDPWGLRSECRGRVKMPGLQNRSVCIPPPFL